MSQNASEERLESISAGADDFISKPADFHELQARVRDDSEKEISPPEVISADYFSPH